MDYVADTIDEFKDTAKIPTENLLPQLLPNLAKQDSRMETILDSSTSATQYSRKTDEVKYHSKFMGDYARLKRKLTTIDQKFKSHPVKKKQRLLHFVNSFAIFRKFPNCKTSAIMPKINGTIIVLYITTPTSPRKV